MPSSGASCAVASPGVLSLVKLILCHNLEAAALGASNPSTSGILISAERSSGNEWLLRTAERTVFGPVERQRTLSGDEVVGAIVSNARLSGSYAWVRASDFELRATIRTLVEDPASDMSIEEDDSSPSVAAPWSLLNGSFQPSTVNVEMSCLMDCRDHEILNPSDGLRIGYQVSAEGRSTVFYYDDSGVVALHGHLPQGLGEADVRELERAEVTIRAVSDGLTADGHRVERLLFSIPLRVANILEGATLDDAFERPSSELADLQEV